MTCEGSVGPMGIQVPDVGVVWARFADKYRDESSDSWLWRKEVERIGNEGKFGWSAGTSIVPSLHELLKGTDAPQVLFSKTQDCGGDQYGGISVWRGAKDVMEGRRAR